MRKDFDRTWHELSEDVITGMKAWRLQHPRATLTEIETALDERLAGFGDQDVDHGRLKTRGQVGG